MVTILFTYLVCSTVFNYFYSFFVTPLSTFLPILALFLNCFVINDEYFRLLFYLCPYIWDCPIVQCIIVYSKYSVRDCRSSIILSDPWQDHNLQADLYVSDRSDQCRNILFWRMRTRQYQLLLVILRFLTRNIRLLPRCHCDKKYDVGLRTRNSHSETRYTKSIEHCAACQLCADLFVVNSDP